MVDQKNKTKAELAKENQILIDKLAEQATDMPNDMLGRYMNELDQISKKGRVDTNKIKVVEINDHKNISLWTPYGKRIGPMHPHNAEKIFKLFWKLGRKLSASQPTIAQIDAYKNTAEYKELTRKEAVKRLVKDKSRKSGSIERLAEAIAKMAGVEASTITDVLPMDKVGK